MREMHFGFAICVNPHFCQMVFLCFSPLEVWSITGLMSYFEKLRGILPLCKLDSDWRRVISTEICVLARISLTPKSSF